MKKITCIRDLVFIPPADVHLDRLEAEDIFTFNSGFDSSGNAELNSEATNPCHNISAYTNLFLRLFNEFDCGCVFYAQPKSAVVICELFDKFYKIKNNQLITQISNGETKVWNIQQTLAYSLISGAVSKHSRTCHPNHCKSERSIKSFQSLGESFW